MHYAHEASSLICFAGFTDHNASVSLITTAEMPLYIEDLLKRK